MEYISSDTNVWIDFHRIDALDLPFTLDLTYIMFEETINREILYPAGLKSRLLALGLTPVQITAEELFYADDLTDIYPRLSVHDRIALAIAKHRSIVLLTGDGALRQAAVRESVEVIGTIGLLDRIYREAHIDTAGYRQCLERLLRYNGGEIRLPAKELERRLKDLEDALER